MEKLAMLSAKVGQSRMAQDFKLTTVESCTGGWIAQCLTDVQGSSAWYECGFVTYSNVSKIQLVGVSPELIDQSGAVSESVVRAMARGALARTAADVALAVTGIAGPNGGTSDKPVGTVWLAWAARVGYAESEKNMFLGDRKAVCYQSVTRALSNLIVLLETGLFL